MAQFDRNDDSVVVIVGSGAGGGTLGNELAQKGIKVVILEAGARNEIQDFVNDEWESFAQLAWTDMRVASGSWRVARDFPNLPAWIVKSVAAPPFTGRGPRCASRSTSSRPPPPMAASRVPISLTGRSPRRNSTRITPRPKTRWG